MFLAIQCLNYITCVLHSYYMTVILMAKIISVVTNVLEAMYTQLIGGLIYEYRYEHFTIRYLFTDFISYQLISEYT